MTAHDENALSLFAIAAPGLEGVVARELTDLGAGGVRAVEGGVEFTGDLSTVYRANLRLRAASRVVIRLGSFPAVSFPELSRKAKNLPWRDYLHPKTPLQIRASSTRSRLTIKKKIADLVADGIGKSLGAPPRLDPEGQLILVRLEENVATISMDTSGELLHRRGYRRAVGAAPLRETLAAGMLMLAGYDPYLPFVDFMCGSGTIPIEAALIALNRAPGRHRRFAFESFPTFDAALWQSLLDKADADALSRPPSSVHCSDLKTAAVAAALDNVERAGLAEIVQVTKNPFTEIVPPVEPGLVLINPPYGQRMADKRGLFKVYGRLGAHLRRHFDGWKFGILTSDARLFARTGLPEAHAHELNNGGTRVRLHIGTVTETSRRNS
ncbi:MAG: class I SAM-dependent RNA methyltransferase [Deltaproteobacteria bacterium]|nr:class I SAM-dependent RNA methyltransferase [Deltaproteobacteria bacterium]